MTLERLITNLAKEKLSLSNSWYLWRQIDVTSLPAGVSLPEGSPYSKNVALKLELNRLWKSVPDRRFDLATYYVSTWGGVRRNRAETLRAYVTEAPHDLILNGLKGVASWSKVLCIRDPLRYAIFDARVSIALNCLQILGRVEEATLFPLLPGQNKTIQIGNKRIRTYADSRNWRRAERPAYYEEYLQLTRKVASNFQDVEVYTIEMLLFAHAKELLSRAFL